MLDLQKAQTQQQLDFKHTQRGTTQLLLVIGLTLKVLIARQLETNLTQRVGPQKQQVKTRTQKDGHQRQVVMLPTQRVFGH